ncbi:hypothetical protein Pth03_64360 [Planotetraspora thailandica]|uniref:MxaD family protein n=1 Tax=Planotetraspora thailandica TaxID=487172 RepID=A0A8J3XZI7_9ACTN|nr:SRPBCC family protein [Planotetraspora thailandica]GII58047.1 hypothetical protein Pth03_64360 [Planotetraspora thailandica]
MEKTYASTVVAADAGTVWAFLRDFGNLAEWLPGVASCEIEEGYAPVPGAVRRIEGFGTPFRERLLALDEGGRSLTYEIVESPLPVSGYQATYRVAPVTSSGEAFVEWYAVYDSADPAEAAKILSRRVFGPGLESLRTRFR